MVHLGGNSFMKSITLYNEYTWIQIVFKYSYDKEIAKQVKVLPTQA